MITSFYKSKNHDFTIVNGDTLNVLREFQFKFDMVFADPPYFLSNGGVTISSGKIVSVDKGDWDKLKSPEEMDTFNREWLLLCRDKLKDNGTIWVSGTHHNIFSIGKLLGELQFKVINVITWKKTNPPQNIFDTHFQYSTEYIIWAQKDNGTQHTFNDDWVRKSNGGYMLTDVWELPAVQMWEKNCGRHPTQKPIPLMARIILSSTQHHAWILDPFCGSGSTGIAASLYGRNFCGIEQDPGFCSIAQKRREEIDNISKSTYFIDQINSVIDIPHTVKNYVNDEANTYYDLPF